MEPIFLKDIEQKAKAGPKGPEFEAMEAQGVPVPQILYVFAFRPRMTDHLSRFTQELMRGTSPLSPGARELIAAFTSNRKQPPFWIGSHAAVAAELLKDPGKVRAVLKDYRTAPISEAERSLFAFVDKVNHQSNQIRREDIEEARAAGWDDEALYDAMTVCALFNFYNRWVDASGVHNLPAIGYEMSGHRLATEGYVRAAPEQTAGKNCTAPQVNPRGRTEVVNLTPRMGTELSKENLERQLGLGSATAAAAGEAIAVSIFLTPAAMARSLASPAWLLLVWVLMGVRPLTGALCYGHLASRFPSAGGGYIYLREAYGPRIVFLYGWMSLLVMDPGATAALAIGLAAYVGDIMPLSSFAMKVGAIGTILGVASINVRETALGAGFVQCVTWLKFSLLVKAFECLWIYLIDRAFPKFHFVGLPSVPQDWARSRCRISEGEGENTKNGCQDQEKNEGPLRGQ